MVKKFTLLELHLDDARFSNAVANTPDEAETMLDEMATDDENDETMDEASASGRSLGRALRMAALATVVAVGVRTIARRFRTNETMGDDGMDDDAASETDDAPIEVDLDDGVEA